MDGFHLAQPELVRQGIRDVMGAPHTFDAAGYVALLRRLHEGGETVYAPEFRRSIEEPIAGAIAVPPEVPLVVTEGNYLLLWEGVKPLLDEAWYVEMDEATRFRWLIERHVAFGKTPEEAEAWVMRSDQRNAEAVAATRGRADVIVRLKVGDHARADRVVRPLVDEDERAGDAVDGVGLDGQRPRDAQADAPDVVEPQPGDVAARCDGRTRWLPRGRGGRRFRR